MDNTLAVLAAQYNNRALINAHEVYQVISPAPKNPQRTATEAICRGEFPLPTIKLNGRRYVRLVDLAELIDSSVNNAVDNHVSAAVTRGPGRPRKIAGDVP